MKYLDDNGLLYFWQRVKEKISKVSGLPLNSIISFEGTEDEVPEGFEVVEVPDDGNESDGILTGSIIEWEEDEIPEGYEEVEGKSFITTGLSANYTATSTNQIILPMKNVFSKYGKAFTVQSDGTILMNKDMYIKIHAQIFFSAANAGSKSLILRLNSDTEISYSVNENVAQYSIIPTHTGILSVKKGDVVKLTAYLYANEVINSMQKNTFMTIEEMEEPRSIKKMSVVEVPKISGSIVDTTNIDDKTTNTYSANIIDTLCVSEVITITKSVNMSTANTWYDTGITGEYLASGTYIVQMLCDFAGQAGQWGEYYSGVMTWYDNHTNGDGTSHITLHNAGHSDENAKIQLRTLHQFNTNHGMKLQILTTKAMSASKNVQFKFRRII